MAGKVSRQVPNKLDLLFNCEPTGDRLEDGADCDPVFADQAAVIDVGENAHQKPAMLSVNGGVECEMSIKHTGSPFDQSSLHAQGCFGQNL